MSILVMNRVKDIKGFTLIEIVAVLVIIGVLGVTAVVKFSSTSTISVRAAAEMIQSDIRYTQAEAMNTNSNRSIDFIAGDGSYTVVLAGVPEDRELPSGVTISVGRMFTFNSLGEPTDGGGEAVSVSDGPNTYIITVADFTGNVSIN